MIWKTLEGLVKLTWGWRISVHVDCLCVFKLWIGKEMSIWRRNIAARFATNKFLSLQFLSIFKLLQHVRKLWFLWQIFNFLCVHHWIRPHSILLWVEISLQPKKLSPLYDRPPILIFFDNDRLLLLSCRVTSACEAISSTLVTKKTDLGYPMKG